MANLTVKTSFNTKLQFDANSIDKRVFAFFIDIALILFYIYAITKISSLFDISSSDNLEGDQSRIDWGISSLLMLPILFYTLISEVLSGGYTVGKYLMKIKVIKVDGFQPTFVDFFIRWIFRMVDIYPFMLLIILWDGLGSAWGSFFTIGLVGLITIMRNKKGQRIGDMVAGTTLIRSKLQQSMDITILKELAVDYKPTYTQVLKLSDNDARIIKDTYEGAKKINDKILIQKLVVKLESVMNIKNNTDPQIFIETVLLDFNYYTQNM